MVVKEQQDFKLFTKILTKLSEIDRIVPVQILKDMLFARSFVSINGASFSSKSFITLDAFLSTVAGLGYHGHFTKQGNVELVMGEAQSGIYHRCGACCSARDIKINELPFCILKMAINMRDPELVKVIMSLL